jgi:hypothetical protein
MLDYVAPLLALLGALVGLLSDARDKTKTGWKALNPTGYIALGVILAGFVLGITTAHKQGARNQRLQATAAAEIEEGWRALVYPFTLMLWQLNGSSVGYDEAAIRSLLTPETFARIGAIDIRGEGPHYSGQWRAILGKSSRNGKASLEATSDKFDAFLDDQLIVDVHNVTSSYYLTVLCGTEDYMRTVDTDPHWTGMPYPLKNLSDLSGAKRYLKALLQLRADLSRHLAQPDSVKE